MFGSSVSPYCTVANVSRFGSFVDRKSFLEKNTVANYLTWPRIIFLASRRFFPSASREAPSSVRITTGTLNVCIFYPLITLATVTQLLLAEATRGPLRCGKSKVAVDILIHIRNAYVWYEILTFSWYFFFFNIPRNERYKYFAGQTRVLSMADGGLTLVGKRFFGNNDIV